MIVTDRLRTFVREQVGPQIAVGREQLLEMLDELDLGNGARIDKKDRETVFDNEACWRKALPALGITYPVENIREEVQTAKTRLSTASSVKRLYFGIPTGAADFWINEDVWAAVLDDVGEETLAALRGCRCRLTGCAYLRARFKVTGNSKKTDSPFSGGPPSRITIVGKGGLLYDPRRDSTVPGGSGPMRADDQSTWRFVTDDGAEIGENLPLILLRRKLGWRITNPATGAKKLATGAGLPPKRLALPSFALAANQADEPVARSAGGTEPRFRGAGVVSEGDDPKSVDAALLAACSGRFLDVTGKIAIQLAVNDLAEAALDNGLDTDDVIGGFTWDPDPALDQTPNVGRGRYVDASDASLYQLVDYPEVRVSSADGIDRYLPNDLGFVESASQAQRVTKQKLQRRQGLRRFSAPFDIRAWSWPVGRVVPFTFTPLGWERKLFRVAEQEIGQGGSCQMVLEAESPLFYQWDGDDRAPVTAVAATAYDPLKDPLVQALGERGAYRWVRRDPEFPVTSDADSVIVAAFTAVLDDGRSLSFPSAEIAATASTEYTLFWRFSTSAYVLVAASSTAELLSSDYFWVGDIATLNDLGEAPPAPTPPPGGGGYGGRGQVN